MEDCKFATEVHSLNVSTQAGQRTNAIDTISYTAIDPSQESSKPPSTSLFPIRSEIELHQDLFTLSLMYHLKVEGTLWNQIGFYIASFATLGIQ
eukprot:85222_1